MKSDEDDTPNDRRLGNLLGNLIILVGLVMMYGSLSVYNSPIGVFLGLGIIFSFKRIRPQWFRYRRPTSSQQYPDPFPELPPQSPTRQGPGSPTS